MCERCELGETLKVKKSMPTPNQDLMKKCTKCGEIKLRTDFYLHSRDAEGKRYPLGECKICTRKRRAKYVEDNYKIVRERDNKSCRDKRARIKETVFAAYGGYKCVCCGETEKLFLTIDHIGNDGANHRRKLIGKRYSAGYHTYIWLVKNNFPQGFQVLCMNCNHGKRMNNGICPHQVRRNDQSKDIGPSGSKRTAPYLRLIDKGEDMVSSAHERRSSL